MLDLQTLQTDRVIFLLVLRNNSAESERFACRLIDFAPSFDILVYLMVLSLGLYETRNESNWCMLRHFRSPWEGRKNIRKT